MLENVEQIEVNQRFLLHIKSGKYTLGIEPLGKSSVMFASLRLFVIACQGESMFLKPLAVFHSQGTVPVLEYSLFKGKSGGKCLLHFSPSP